MKYLAFLSFILIPGGLLYAHLVSGPGWTNGLYVSGGGISLLAVLFVLIGMKRSRENGWQGPSAAILGGAAALTRLGYTRWRYAPIDGPDKLVPWEFAAVSFYWTTGLFSLVLGAFAILQAVTAPENSRKNLNLVTGCIGLTAGLYCFASVSRRLGINANHWTFLGILGLAMIAFLPAVIAQKLSIKKRHK